MAKEVYNIRDSLDKSFLDIEIAITGKDGTGLRPVPMRLVLAVIASGFICLFMVSQTFVAAGGPVGIFWFVVAWVIISFLLLKPDSTGEMALMRIPTVLGFIPKSARKVDTRSSGYIGDFYSVANIDHIEHEDGIVCFADGDVGLVFAVVGNASVLLFDDDREAIVNRFDKFLTPMKTDYELIFITAKEGQNVVRPVNKMNERLSRESDPELRALIEYERDFMATKVARDFKSIHQYLILKAANMEALIAAHSMLLSEVQNSTLVFKRCTALYDDELLRVFSSVFKGKESA